MKKVSGLLLLLCLLSSCDNANLKEQQLKTEIVVDSLKWLFYAYEFNGTALFKKDQRSYNFKPTECAIRDDTLFSLSNDSVEIHLSFYKEGYSFSHVYEGFNFYGFLYGNSVAKPLSGNIVFDNFDDPIFLKNDNRTTDSVFREYLKATDSSKLSSWLLKEAKKRGVL
jgi:hypothetical protein